jgi:hypothetical protein
MSSLSFPKIPSGLAGLHHQYVPKTEYLHNSDTVTVAVAADKWIEVCKKTGRRGRKPVEKATLRPYRLHARYINDMIGGRRLNELTPHVCERLAADLLDCFSRRYARKILTFLKGILSEARTQGWLKSDPAENVRIVLSERARPQHDSGRTLAEVRTRRRMKKPPAPTNRSRSAGSATAPLSM